ncbi:hypothetical protein [Micromonospora echinofusca]|uniref:Uncharacterized protein n=1 Tax=Micromonospora echinofusca TaxID=47858 RepID=A0A1C5GFY9_MICEH|nr:hypothetical protein [Micromonospora echinofusca]SCG18667.1 hypothetical protein GA0070610_5018 [Micromonospora echinofusca]
MRSQALVSTRTAIAGATGNAVVMGVAGVSTPLGWVLLPGLLGVSARPRVAALVSAWAAVLLAASVVVPVVPGHRADPWALGASAASLAAVPLLAWARRRRTERAIARVPAPRDVAVFALPAGTGRAALAVCRSPGEVAAAVPLRRGGLRVLVGVAHGATLARPERTRALESAFRREALRRGRSLPAIAGTLGHLVRDLAPGGYLAATLVEVSPDGRVTLLRHGGPDVAVRAGEATRPGELPDAGPLGLVEPGASAAGATGVEASAARTSVAGPPAGARRLAVAPAAEGAAWHRLTAEALRSPRAVDAVVALTGRPGGGRRTGPALVLDLPPERSA